MAFQLSCQDPHPVSRANPFRISCIFCVHKLCFALTQDWELVLQSAVQMPRLQIAT